MELPLKRYWALMFQYLSPLRGKVVLLGIFIFTSLGLKLINPQLVRTFIDTAVSTSLLQPLINTAVLYLITSLILQFISVAARYLSEDIGWRSTNELRADLARHCLHLDMSFHNDHTPGEMIERVDGDVANIAIFFSEFVLRILGNLLLILGVLIALLWVDWRVSLGLFIFATVSLFLFGKLRAIAVPHWKEAREANANLFGFIEEQLAGTEDVRANGAVPYVMRRLFGLHRTRIDKEISGADMSIKIILSWITMFGIGLMMALWASYTLFQAGLITIGTAYLIINYTNIIFQPLREITNQIQQLQQAAAGIERVETLVQMKSKIKDGQTAVFPKGSLSVQFNRVTFAYHDKEPILHDIDFELKQGQVLGLLGRTGSGKTTLTRLLFRLYQPQTGSIRLGTTTSHPANGHNSKSHLAHTSFDIQESPLVELRQHIGMVTQDVQLFRATVRDNLTFFDSRVPDDKIISVIEQLGLGEWFRTLPYGLDTLLKSEGTSLSAGEAQLLAFTRVFLKDPGLVIMDEASSRLDPATEQLIEQAIDKLLQNRTGIIVAHRLGTVARADQIMIMEHGRIAEHGAYEKLANDPDSRFFNLLQTGMAVEQG